MSGDAASARNLCPPAVRGFARFRQLSQPHPWL